MTLNGRTFAIAASLAAALTLVACGGVGGDTDLGGGTSDMAGPTGVQPHFSSLMGDYFGNCSACHAPNAPGRTSETEMTLDFSSKTTAYQTITTGMASGLTGNQAGCNGTRFITSGMPEKSLIVAVLDEPTRAAFDIGNASCDAAAIPDMTAKVGSAPSSAFITALKGWITAGAPND